MKVEKVAGVASWMVLCPRRKYPSATATEISKYRIGLVRCADW